MNAPGPVSFVDVAAATGLDFNHFIGATGQFYLPEIMAPGCAFLDYDNDGDLDVYLVQGTLLDKSKTCKDATFPPQVPLPPRNRLYRNELISGGKPGGALRFTDVTTESGTGDAGYGMGVATGDYDNDGDVDIFVTNFGPDVLLRNNGDGTFADVTARAGLGDARWGTSASFVDYDRDGWLDLVVAAYADFTLSTNKPCFATTGVRTYCSPKVYPPLPPRLYRNQGDGTFRNVASEAGIDQAYGHGLGVAAVDFDGNGWMDIYVANDADPNQLWMNRGGRFADEGMLSGTALNHAGHAEAGMGVAIGDCDNDGDPDILVTHLRKETHTLYVNLGGMMFEDRTTRAKLTSPSLRCTGFGVAFLDVDNDADLDLFAVNGDVRYLEDSLTEDPYPYRQPNQLLLQKADGTFREITDQTGPAMQLSEVSRGLAIGDVDNDGDIDLLIGNNNGPVRLLRNDLAEQGNWLILRIVDAATGRDALGAAVRLKLSDGRILTRYVKTDGSFCSAGDPRVHFGWPESIRMISVEVVLPGGRSRRLSNPAPRTISTVVVRAGDAESSP